METPFATPLTLVPVRKAPADAAELVTQLLLGDTGVILQKDRQWRLVRQHRDGYEGWVDEKTIVEMDPTWEEKSQEWLDVRQDDLRAKVSVGGIEFEVVCLRGGRLPVSAQASGKRTGALGPWRFEVSAEAVQPDPQSASLADAVAPFVGAPYLWGGKSRNGIDCSGLTQLCAWQAGIALPRDARQQAQVGTQVPTAEARRGDLAFFANAEGRITHTGILLGDGLIAHAHGFVRRDKFTDSGILSLNQGRITHTLSHVMRIS